MWLPGGPAGTGSVLTATMVIGLTVIAQTTVILAMGLLFSFLAKRQGPVAQAFVLRMVLVLAVVCPFLTLMFVHERAIVLPVPGVVDADTSVSKLSPVTPIDTYIRTLPALSRIHNRITDSSRPAVTEKPVTAQYLPSAAPEPSLSKRTDPIFPVHTSDSGPAVNQILQAVKSAPPLVPVIIHKADITDFKIPVHVLYILYAAFIMFWLLCSLYLAMRALRDYLFLQRFRRHAEPVDPTIETECSLIAQCLGVTVPVIRWTPHLVSPIISGIRRPMILLPTSLPDNAGHLSEIFLHELTHLKRHDQFWNYLRQVFIICLPVQPLIWLYARYFDEVSDYVCDAVVTAHTKDSRSYATTLFAIASRYQAIKPASVPGIGFISFASPLRRRIERIMNSAGKVPLKLSIRFMIVASTLCAATAALSDAIGFEGRTMTVSFGKEPFRNQTVMRPPVDLTLRPVYDNHETDAVPKGDLSIKVSTNPIVADPDAFSDRDESFERIVELADSQGMAETSVTRSKPRDMSAISGWNEEAIKPIAYESARMYMSAGNADETTGAKIPVDTVVADGLMGETVDNVAMVQADVGSGGAAGDDNGSMAWFFTAQSGMTLPSLSETRIQVPVSKAVQVTVPDYQNGMFDLSDPDQLQQYNVYVSLDKNKNEPAWSPDGNWIVFTDKNRIWMVSVSGGDPQLVFENFYEHDGRKFPIGGIESILFAPDGASLIFKIDSYDISCGSNVTFREIEENRTIAYFENPIPQIVRLNLKTNTTTTLVYGGYNCALSRDGMKLCYLIADLPDDANDLSRIHHPVVLNMRNGRSEQLNNDTDIVFGKPAFTPDSAHVILPAREGNNPIELVRLSLDSTQLVPLTIYDPDSGHGKYMEYSAVSPDGEWVMYTDFTNSTDRPDKRLMLYSTLSGERFEMFPEAEDRRAYGTWSPDGTHICYLATEINGNVLYVCRFEPRLYKINIPEDVSEPDEPLVFSLGNPYPNPFNSEVSIRYILPDAGEMKLVIFNSMGQRVRELIQDYHEPGEYTARWDGCDDEGRSVSSGVYIARLVTDRCWTTQKMTLAK